MSSTTHAHALTLRNTPHAILHKLFSRLLGFHKTQSGSEDSVPGEAGGSDESCWQTREEEREETRDTYLLLPASLLNTQLSSARASPTQMRTCTRKHTYIHTYMHGMGWKASISGRYGFTRKRTGKNKTDEHDTHSQCCTTTNNHHQQKMTPSLPTYLHGRGGRAPTQDVSLSAQPDSLAAVRPSMCRVGPRRPRPPSSLVSK
jgi:hypothetical protein